MERSLFVLMSLITGTTGSIITKRFRRSVAAITNAEVGPHEVSLYNLDRKIAGARNKLVKTASDMETRWIIVVFDEADIMNEVEQCNCTSLHEGYRRLKALESYINHVVQYENGILQEPYEIKTKADLESLQDDIFLIINEMDDFLTSFSCDVSPDIVLSAYFRDNYRSTRAHQQKSIYWVIRQGINHLSSIQGYINNLRSIPAHETEFLIC